VEVRYDPLPAVSRPELALAPDSPRLHPDVPGNVSYRVRRTHGDVQGAFGRAAHRVTVRAAHHRIAAVPLEPRGLLVVPSSGLRVPSQSSNSERATRNSELTVYASSQAPHGLRRGLARGLGLDEERIRVVAPDVGGGFGVKGGMYRDDLVVATLALK